MAEPATFDFTHQAPAPRPVELKAHRVRTMPALLLALQDLQKEADALGVKHIDLGEISPRKGVDVRLIDFGGRLYVSFEGLRA